MALTDDQLELLSAYVDDELNHSERGRIERLLEHDASARRALAELKQTAARVRGLPAERAPGGMAADVLERLARQQLLSIEAARGASRAGLGVVVMRRFAIAAGLVLAVSAGLIGWRATRTEHRTADAIDTAAGTSGLSADDHRVANGARRGSGASGNATTPAGPTGRDGLPPMPIPDGGGKGLASNIPSRETIPVANGTLTPAQLKRPWVQNQPLPISSTRPTRDRSGTAGGATDPTNTVVAEAANPPALEGPANAANAAHGPSSQPTPLEGQVTLRCTMGAARDAVLVRLDAWSDASSAAASRTGARVLRLDPPNYLVVGPAAAVLDMLMELRSTVAAESAEVVTAIDPPDGAIAKLLAPALPPTTQVTPVAPPAPATRAAEASSPAPDADTILSVRVTVPADRPPAPAP